MKDKYVEKLILSELCRIENTAILGMFLRQVRQLPDSETEKLDQALTRMDRDLHLYVSAKFDKGEVNNVNQLEELLKREFKGPASLADAIRELHHHTYDLSVNAREFAHKFKIRYETIFQSFPHESRPSRTTVLKSVMTEHLPCDVKGAIIPFMAEGYSEMFLTVRKGACC